MGINKEPHYTQEVIKPESLPAEQLTSPQQDEEEEDDDDDDDGPPPGFDSIPINLSTHDKEAKSAQQVEEEEEEDDDDDDDDDDDGPPPGFQLIATKIEKSNEKSYQEEDDDGPPPGFEDDGVAIPNSHSIPTVEVETVNGLSPICNSRSVGDGSKKLGFQPISVKGEGDDDVEMPNSHSMPVVEGGIEDGLNPNCNSESVSGYGSETLGYRSVLVREEEREGDRFELGFQSREEKREVDGSRLGLQSFSVKNEEKLTDGYELGFHSVHGIGGERDNDEFELGSQSVPVKEGEKEQSISEKNENDDNDDEGPPPGWDSFPPPRQPIESPAPPSAFLCGIGFQSTQVKEEEKVGDEFELGSLLVPMKEDGKDGGGFELEFQSISDEEEGGGNGGEPSFPLSQVKKEEEKDDDEGPPPGWDSFPPARPPSEAPASPQLPSLTPPPSHPRPSADSSGKAQMVCGSCRKLLSYSRGVRFVQCSCCQTVNLVLEEHQVGQVKCRGCAVLLMYPFGAPSVQCSSCLFVTKVGVQNKRPPLSVQQGRPKLPGYLVH